MKRFNSTKQALRLEVLEDRRVLSTVCLGDPIAVKPTFVEFGQAGHGAQQETAGEMGVNATFNNFGDTAHGAFELPLGNSAVDAKPYTLGSKPHAPINEMAVDASFIALGSKPHYQLDAKPVGGSSSYLEIDLNNISIGGDLTACPVTVDLDQDRPEPDKYPLGLKPVSATAVSMDFISSDKESVGANALAVTPSWTPLGGWCGGPLTPHDKVGAQAKPVTASSTLDDLIIDPGVTGPKIGGELSAEAVNGWQAPNHGNQMPVQPVNP